MVIKTLNTENPFADYGNIIIGSRFVGRKYAIEAIHNRVLGSSYGNLAIMGLPRIGKSSLAWNFIMAIKDELVNRKIIVERLDIGSIRSINDFYLRLMDKTLRNIRSLNLELFDQLLDVRKSYFDASNDNEIEYFFALVKQFDYRLIYILDEFDKVANYFKFEDFQLLRELSISPETKICLITVSRRTIQELEAQNGAISNFYSVFSDLRLGTFTEFDLDEYWGKAISAGIEVNEEYKQKIDYLVGKHPFLIDLFNYFVFNSVKSKNKIDIKEIIYNIESERRLNLFSNFDYALNLLKEENLYSKTLQLVLGPVYDVNSSDEQKLLKYEFIREVDNNYKEQLLGSNCGLKTSRGTSYICFSNYLTEYLKLKIDETDFWSLWKDTENSVRGVIKEFIKESFGNDDWETAYLHKNPSEKRELQLNKLKNERDKSLKNFGPLASPHIVDYSYPMDMYDLFISTDWSWFSKVFVEKDKKFWANIFNELAFLRNPVAHNNSEFVPIERITTAKSYCELILTKIKDWQNSR